MVAGAAVDLALEVLVQSRDDVEEGSLSAPVRPGHDHEGAGVGCELQVLQHHDLRAHPHRGEPLLADLDGQGKAQRRHLLALAMSGCRIAISMICTTIMKAS